MNRLEVFNQYRPLLFGIAYRMLGSTVDAEDMLQETWIRCQTTSTIAHSPKSFLASLITRLCIDQLRSARVQRENYIGTWLPEPLVTEYARGDKEDLEMSESIAYAFLLLLEQLSPVERAIFLLREVFDYDYSAISTIVGKSIANCRQIVCRARGQLKSRTPASSSSLQDKQEIVQKFMSSWNQGDVHELIALMSENVAFWSDGGGYVSAALRPLHGRRKVAQFLVALRRSPLVPVLRTKLVKVNACPGILNLVEGRPQSTFGFDFSGQTIQSIYAVANPYKLGSVEVWFSQSKAA